MRASYFVLFAGLSAATGFSASPCPRNVQNVRRRHASLPDHFKYRNNNASALASASSDAKTVNCLCAGTLLCIFYVNVGLQALRRVLGGKL